MCRRGELVAFDVGDVQRSAGEVVVSFRREKARRPGIVGPRAARSVACVHPLLIRALATYDRRYKVGNMAEDHPLFFTLADHQCLAPSWVGRIVRQRTPWATAHSLRVGFATEAYAAGCSVEIIKKMGRWSSDAALHYIIGSIDVQKLASTVVGRGGLSLGVSGRMRTPLDREGLDGGVWRIPDVKSR